MRANTTVTAAAAALTMAFCLPAHAADDTAEQIAKLKTQLVSGYVSSCVPEAKKSGNASDEVATTYCKCSVSFVDDLSDSDLLDLVNSDLKKERPKNDTYLKMLSKMDSCKKAATAK